ncbi:MAG: Tfp pilus assembly protein PilX [Sulfurimonas sp.]|jgi:Tfp pilus assembly protein PilX
MQRKNSILRTTHKNGMAIIMAITVLVVISTIMALSLALTTKTSKRTTDLYLYEQATLLSHSAAEYAILKASQQSPCSLANINFNHNDMFNIDVTMRYVSYAGTSCSTNAPSGNIKYFATTTYPDSDGTIIMDIVVTDLNISTEPIRYFRRSIQKL